MFTLLVNKNATGRRAFLQDRFSDKTFSTVGSKFAEDFEFFVLTTLENYHQIRIVLLGLQPVTLV